MAESSEQPVTARYFDYNGVNLEAQSIAQLSQGASANGTVRRGYLADMVPAIYVNSSLGDGGLVTDILAVRDGILTNITLDREMKISAGTLRYYTARHHDIDGTDVMRFGSQRFRLSGQREHRRRSGSQLVALPY